jgi:hypothetical protein
MAKKRLILLVMLIAVISMISACGKKTKARHDAEWHGLTESEARSKLDAKLPGKIPAEKRSEISDKIVAKMRDRGVITEDPTVPDDASELTDEADQLDAN